jgi:hypothetical protein
MSFSADQANHRALLARGATVAGCLFVAMTIGCGGGAAVAAPPSETPEEGTEEASEGEGSEEEGGKSAKGDNSLDTYDEDVKRIKTVVPGWDNGTGIAVRYQKVSTGSILSLIYVDPTPPEWKEKSQMWIVISKATVEGQAVSTVALSLSSMKPGRYEGSDTKRECVIGAALGTDKWEPSAADTGWSLNEGGFCEVELREGKQPGHLEGTFRGKLKSNAEDSFYLIKEGYIYINR